MQALIVHDESQEVERLGRALSRRGFMVSARANQQRAIAFIRRTPVDLLVLKQVIDGRHTTSVALAAEYHNPSAATVLLSDVQRQDALELFELLPSLRAIVGAKPDATTLSNLGLHAMQTTDQPMLVLLPHDRIAPAPPTQFVA